MYTANEILFPAHVIPTLQNLRGASWQKLVLQIAPLPETDERKLAFMLMMIRLNGCMACETDSFRAMKGCMSCAHQVLRRFKGTDEELLEMYDKALEDVRVFENS